MARNLSYLDKGSVGVVEYDKGAGWVDFGIISGITFSPEPVILKHYNVQSASKIGLDSLELGGANPKLSFVWEEVANPVVWQEFIMASAITPSGAGTVNVTGEALVLTDYEWAGLTYGGAGIFKSDCTVAVKKGVTTYTENTDYIVDRRTGAICRKGSGISSGDSLTVDYVYNTFNGQSMEMYSVSAMPTFGLRWTKPLSNGTTWIMTHSKCAVESVEPWNVAPSAEAGGTYQSVKPTIAYLLDESGAYGDYGTLQIVTVS